MNGKEFKEEIRKIDEKKSQQDFFAIDKEDVPKLMNFLESDVMNYSHYTDHGLLFADIETTNIMNVLINSEESKISDEKEIKVSPIHFVNNAMCRIYDNVVCEDALTNIISNAVDSIIDDLANGEFKED